MNRGPNALQKLLHRGLMLGPVSMALSRILHRADLLLLHLSSGRHTFAEWVGLPIAQVSMLGARSGQRRTLPLVSIPTDGRLLLVASNFGQRRNPGWYHNLKKHPECEVLFHGQSGFYVARELEGEEYRRYWELALTYYAGYEKYRERATPRHIPVLLLEPQGSARARAK